MKVLATGKWNKEQKRWSMLVALRRPSREGAAADRRTGDDGSSGKSRPKR